MPFASRRRDCRRCDIYFGLARQGEADGRHLRHTILRTDDAPPADEKPRLSPASRRSTRTPCYDITTDISGEARRATPIIG